jgi:hypothetical protein
MRAIIFLVIVLVGAVFQRWMRKRREGDWRTRAEPERVALAEWAAANGWQVGDGSDVELAEAARGVRDRAGLPGDAVDGIAIGVGDVDKVYEHQLDKEASDHDRARYYAHELAGGDDPGWTTGFIEYGRLLRRRFPEGEVLVFDCWPAGGQRLPRVHAALSTGGALPAATVDRLADGRKVLIGEAPTLDGQFAFSAGLDGLGAPARLRLIQGWILLQFTGVLTRQAFADAGHRLRSLAAELA